MMTCFRRWLLVAVLLLPIGSPAHPGAGLAVARDGRIFFTDTGAGVWVIEGRGELKRISESAVHWMALAGGEGTADFGPRFEVLPAPAHGATLILASDQPCAVDADGGLVYSGAGDDGVSVHRRDRGGKESVVVDAARMREVFPAGTMATGIATGRDGLVFVVVVDDESGAHAVVAVGRDGHPRVLSADFLTGVKPHAALSAERGNPCRGIASDPEGGVAVAGTADRCVVRIDRQGQAKVVLRSPAPWSPTAVAFQGEELLVLEYTDMPPGADASDRTLWVPRVRRVSANGGTVVVAEVQRQRSRRDGLP